MKHLSLLKNMVLACGTLVAAVALSSCSSTISPNKAAEKLASSADVTIFSHNDANRPVNRDCREAGPIPDRAARAMGAWLRNSTVKKFSYAYPQYYVAMQNPRTGRQSAWGICSDDHGNLVGILIPRDGVMAWDLPAIGDYRMYVCDTPSRKALGDAVMNSLAEAGYDTYRIDSRKAKGLTQQRYLISKPLSDEAQKRYDMIKKQEEEALKALAERTPSASTDSYATDDSSDDEEDSSDEDYSDGSDSGDDSDDSSSDEDSGSDDGFDELGF